MPTIRIAIFLPLMLMSLSCTDRDETQLAAFEWMTGDWDAQSGSVSEHWQAVSGNTFEGRGVTTSQDKVSTETMRLVCMEGEVYFIAKVAHNDYPVAFRLSAESSPGHGVFVNPTHDFPKRIVYDRDGADGMTVTVSDGGSQGFQLRFVRR